LTPSHRNATKALATAALVLGAASGCGTDQAMAPDWSIASGSYYLPRHATLSATPLGLAVGTVVLRDHCLYLGPNLLIWPKDYSLVQRDGATVIVGGGWTIAPGDAIEAGGGQYANSADLPSSAIGGFPPCPGPYMWIAAIQKAGPTESG
jgi:hypothetical protein